MPDLLPAIGRFRGELTRTNRASLTPFGTIFRLALWSVALCFRHLNDPQGVNRYNMRSSAAISTSSGAVPVLGVSFP